MAGGGRVGDHVQHSITSHTHLDEPIGQFDDTAAERWSALSVDPATSVRELRAPKILPRDGTRRVCLDVLLVKDYIQDAALSFWRLRGPAAWIPLPR